MLSVSQLSSEWVVHEGPDKVILADDLNSEWLDSVPESDEQKEVLKLEVPEKLISVKESLFESEELELEEVIGLEEISTMGLKETEFEVKDEFSEESDLEADDLSEDSEVLSESVE